MCNTGRPVDPEFAAVARRTREEHDARHLSKLVDPSDLPQRSVHLSHFGLMPTPPPACSTQSFAALAHTALPSLHCSDQACCHVTPGLRICSERGARRMDEGFWRASASGHKRSVKKKRRASTLPRGAARKRLRKAGVAARCSNGHAA